MSHSNQELRNVRPAFIRFSSEIHDFIDDLRLQRQRQERRYVTKTELFEEAVRLLAMQITNNK